MTNKITPKSKMEKELEFALIIVSKDLIRAVHKCREMGNDASFYAFQIEDNLLSDEYAMIVAKSMSDTIKAYEQCLITYDSVLTLKKTQERFDIGKEDTTNE